MSDDDFHESGCTLKSPLEVHPPNCFFPAKHPPHMKRLHLVVARNIQSLVRPRCPSGSRKHAATTTIGTSSPVLSSKNAVRITMKHLHSLFCGLLRVFGAAKSLKSRLPGSSPTTLQPAWSRECHCFLIASFALAIRSGLIAGHLAVFCPRECIGPRRPHTRRAIGGSVTTPNLQPVVIHFQ